MNKRILFRDKEYVLTEGGAIATREDIEAFRESYAYLFPDGRIFRYGRLIGHREDITILGDSDAEHTVEGFLTNAFKPEAWPGLGQ